MYVDFGDEMELIKIRLPFGCFLEVLSLHEMEFRVAYKSRKENMREIPTRRHRLLNHSNLVNKPKELIMYESLRHIYVKTSRVEFNKCNLTER